MANTWLTNTPYTTAPDGSDLMEDPAFRQALEEYPFPGPMPGMFNVPNMARHLRKDPLGTFLWGGKGQEMRERQETDEKRMARYEEIKALRDNPPPPAASTGQVGAPGSGVLQPGLELDANGTAVSEGGLVAPHQGEVLPQLGATGAQLGSGMRRFSSAQDPRIEELVSELAGMERPDYAGALRRNEHLGMIANLMGNPYASRTGEMLYGFEQNNRDRERQSHVDRYQQMSDELNNRGRIRDREAEEFRWKAERDKWDLEFYEDTDSGIKYSYERNPYSGQTRNFRQVTGSRLDRAIRQQDEEALANDLAKEGEVEGLLRKADKNYNLVMGGDVNTGPIESWAHQIPGGWLSTGAATNTRELEMELAQVILPQVKQLGFNPSNVDLKFVEKSVPKLGDSDETWRRYMGRLRYGLLVHRKTIDWKRREYESGRIPTAQQEADFIARQYPDGDDTYLRYANQSLGDAVGGNDQGAILESRRQATRPGDFDNFGTQP